MQKVNQVQEVDSNAVWLNIPIGFCEILQADSKICMKMQMANNSQGDLRKKLSGF